MSKIVKVDMYPVNSEEVLECVVGKCNFCMKKSITSSKEYSDIIRLGHGHFYCSFCLRNRFTFKKKKDILLLDFRGIFGFYINYLYHEEKIWKSQIFDHIRKHTIIGLKNPLFSYDYESMLWFVDFTRTGTGKHQISVQSIKDTVSDIINSTKINTYVINANIYKLKEKYKEAIDEFYKFRKRPENRRVLSPTLNGCLYRANANWEDSKIFYIKNGDELSPIGSHEYSIKHLSEDLTTEVYDTIVVNIKRKIYKEIRGFEAYLEIPEISKCKLLNEDGGTIFEDKKKLKQTARELSKKLCLGLVFIDNTTAT